MRNQFAKKMRGKFTRICAAINKAIVDQDVFGLKQSEFKITVLADIPIPSTGAFDFPTSQAKVDAFMEWINQLIADELLEVANYQQLGQASNAAWTNMYIQDAYQRGLQRARQELTGHGYDVPPLSETGGLAASMSLPFHLERVGLLYARTYSDLKGITAAMDQQISKVLSQGMIDGDNPRVIAKKLIATLRGTGDDLGITDTLGRFIPAERRAEMLARTEVIRTHHAAMMQEYKNWALADVHIIAEWATAGDSRVCEKCGKLQGKRFKLEEAMNLIPLHPNCRCIALPIEEKVNANINWRRK